MSEAEQLGLGHAVVFAGFRRDVVECLCAADLFVNFSQTEALPVSLLEAMAAGLPTVAPRIGGIPHALGTPEAGILVAAGDEPALAAGMASLAMDDDLRSRLGGIARCHARRFSLETFVTNYCSLYESVLEMKQ
jgi:glycosyltransferase involved in cell wall biosynthesis